MNQRTRRRERERGTIRGWDRQTRTGYMRGRGGYGRKNRSSVQSIHHKTRLTSYPVPPFIFPILASPYLSSSRERVRMEEIAMRYIANWNFFSFCLLLLLQETSCRRLQMMHHLSFVMGAPAAAPEEFLSEELVMKAKVGSGKKETAEKMQPNKTRLR